MLSTQWGTVRALRDAKLRITDLLVIRAQENSEPVADELRAYRQALRDITADFDIPDDVIWPTKPT